MVYLVDFVRPPAFDAIFEAVLEVAPWAGDKIKFLEINVDKLLEADQVSCLP